MKLRFIGILILLAAVLLCVAMPTEVASAESVPVLLLSGSKSAEGGEIVVTATLKKNEGLSDLVLTLDYDREKLTLTECTKGDALADLDWLPSGNYDVNPYKISWSGEANDSSNGTLLTLRFAVKEGADGETNVRFTYVRDRDVLYRVNGDYKALNLMADSLRIDLSSGTATEIVSDKVGENALAEEDNTKLVVGLAVGGSVAILLIVGIPWFLARRKKVV